MFFDSWDGLARVLIVGTAAYVALIVLVRISGKRTLAKLNAFDLVVTVALGSTLSSILLSSSVALAEGVLALALLIGLQAAVAWTSVRSQHIRRLVRSEPTLVVYRGELLAGALRRERVADSDVRQALRQQGKSAVDQVGAMVLEPDGSLSVVSDPDAAILRDTALRR